MNYPGQPEVKHTYEIIIESTKAKLASVINAKLKDGYLLAGEFRVEQIKDKFTYLQPMMKSIIMPPTAPPPSSLKNEDISDAEFVPVDA